MVDDRTSNLLCIYHLVATDCTPGRQDLHRLLHRKGDSPRDCSGPRSLEYLRNTYTMTGHILRILLLNSLNLNFTVLHLVLCTSVSPSLIPGILCLATVGIKLMVFGMLAQSSAYGAQG